MENEGRVMRREEDRMECIDVEKMGMRDKGR